MTSSASFSSRPARGNIEGVMPFIAPHRWREVLLQVAGLNVRSLRIMGFLFITAGALALNFL